MGKVLNFVTKGGIGMTNCIVDVEQAASQVLAENHAKDIPIDPILIANKLGIKVYEVNFKDNNMSGIITKQDDKVVIYIEKDHHPNRQRFTVAHEIGHYILHIKNDSVHQYIEYQRNDNYDPKEVEANNFAGALLMPKDKIIKTWNKYKELTIDVLITILSKEFIVSESAMRIRLNNLGLIGYE